MRGDFANPGAYGETHLDHFVQRGFIACGAKRTVVFLLVHSLERGAGVEYATAARTQQIPRHFKQSQPCAMQECGNRQFLVEIVGCGKIKDVDAIERAVRAFPHQAFDRLRHRRVGGLAQRCKPR